MVNFPVHLAIIHSSMHFSHITKTSHEKIVCNYKVRKLLPIVGFPWNNLCIVKTFIDLQRLDYSSIFYNHEQFILKVCNYILFLSSCTRIVIISVEKHVYQYGITITVLYVHDSASASFRLLMITFRYTFQIML